MANVFKYLTGNPTRRALKKGNLARGIGLDTYGPTSETGYYAGVNPPNGGYVITTLRGDNIPSYQVAQTDADLVNFANNMGAGVSTGDEAKVYFAGRDNTWIYNKEPENLITDGLILNLDATALSSYPGSGNIWNDLTSNSNGNLINGLTFNSGNRFPGYINFDGSNDYIQVDNWDRSSTTNTYTVEMWARWRAGTGDMFMGFTTYDIWTNGGALGFNTGAGDVYGISSTQVENLGLRGIDEDNWHHYIFQFTNQVQNNKIYIDTIEQTLSQQYGTTNLTSGRGFPSSFRIGTWNNSTGYLFTGDVASFRMYNRALTQQEINFNYFGSNVEVDGDYVKIFRQYSGDGDFFSSSNDWVEAKSTNVGNPNANKYSILDTLEKYKRDNKFTFKLNYPQSGLTNIWSQTNNPVTDDGSGGVTGYTAISIDMTSNGWGGLERYDAQSSTFIDGTLSPQSNWYYAIGSKSWGSATTFPGHSPAVNEVELWVKYK